MRATLAAILVLATGCSIVTMRHLPAGHDGSEPPRCDDSKGYVAADVLFAIATVGVTVGTASWFENDDGTVSNAGVLVGVTGFVAALAMGVSALVADGEADRCARAKETYRWTRARRERSDDE